MLTCRKCWLSIPALIYLVMAPMWSRAQRFASVYAFAAIDILFCILWFSAWAAVASYVASGKGKGDNKKKSGCDNFSHGSAARCKLSEATVFLGVAICLLFGATSYFSIKGAMDYRRTGMMPTMPNEQTSFAAQTKDDFSSHPNDEFDDDLGRPGDGNGPPAQRHSDDDEYALLHQSEADDMAAHPGRPVSYGLEPGAIHEYDTAYGGAYGRRDDEAGPGRAGYPHES